MQAVGGSFILKIYDIFHENTLKTISFIKKFYKNIYIVKPLSSRPANSEKYLVCVGFIEPSETDVNMLGNLIQNYNDKNVKVFFDKLQHNPCVLHNLICYNIYYTLRQIFYIEQTISYITEFGRSYHDSGTKEQLKKIMESHKTKAVKWCDKYKLDHV